ncbi:YALIA101S10e03862g1_1 [Yarrowia lipolytica]|nr:YALIA101S10e03862g1_1 [Yarrowia lipolytica]VBB88813.1 Hypothetical protein of a 19-member gene family, conserved in the Yarrowia clade [Yarrowia lipolytica]
MLPPELLSMVCTYLEPRDLLALAETSRSQHVALSDIRKMLLRCPYFSLEHSDWSSWQALADNYNSHKEAVAFTHIQMDDHYNKPLPDDFIALQGDIQRKSRYWWNYCDRGIYDQTSSSFVDLRTDSGTDTYMSKEEARSFFFGNVRSDDDYIHYQHTTDTATVLARRGKEVVLQIKYRGEEDYHEFLISSSSSYLHSYELQQIDNVAFVYRCDSDEENEGTYCVAPGRGLVPVEDGGGSTSPPYGWLHYNGCLYKGIYNEKRDLQIVSAHYQDNTKRPMGGYEICHDERHPRYGIAYSAGGLFPLFVVDLKRHLITAVHLDKDHLPVIGISNGRMGVWKYTHDYLDQQCCEQDKPGVQKVMDEIFEELELCIEAMNEVGDGDFDPVWF